LARDYIELGDDSDARAEAAEVEQLRVLDPDSAIGYYALAQVENTMAKPAEALVALGQTMRLDPRDPDKYLIEQGKSYSQLGRYEEAILAFKRYIAGYPDNFWSHAYLVQDYIELGRDDAARAEATEVLRLNPQFSLKMMSPTVSPKGKVLEYQERFNRDLRKAGLK
jgi:adenylate cyclase